MILRPDFTKDTNGYLCTRLPSNRCSSFQSAVSVLQFCITNHTRYLYSVFFPGLQIELPGSLVTLGDNLCAQCRQQRIISSRISILGLSLVVAFVYHIRWRGSLPFPLFHLLLCYSGMFPLYMCTDSLLTSSQGDIHYCFHSWRLRVLCRHCSTLAIALLSRRRFGF